MTQLELGHIYKIFTPLDNSFCYIGSTYKTLDERFKIHKYNFYTWVKDKNKIGKCSIYDYFEKYGFENFKIILIKSYNVVKTSEEDSRHLHAYELLSILNTKNCINISKPFNPLLKLDKKRINKNYYEENADKIKQYGKIYYQENVDKEKERKKKYYDANRDIINNKHKKYREDNADKLKAKYTCQCGSILVISQKLRHNKTNKHIQYCEKNNII